MRSSDEVDTERVEKEKFLRGVEGKLGEARQILNDLDKDRLRLALKRKDASILVDQYEFQVKRLKSDLRILSSEFWSSRRDEGR